MVTWPVAYCTFYNIVWTCRTG